MALSSLQSDMQSVTDLGGGRYQLAVSLLNAGGGEPIYVMSPDMHAYVQVGMVWQEVPLRPVDDGAGGVVKSTASTSTTTRSTPRSGTSPSCCPTICTSDSRTRCVFERRDYYYVYLKPFDIADDVILKRMRFPGKPPVWIPMPPD